MEINGHTKKGRDSRGKPQGANDLLAEGQQADRTCNGRNSKATVFKNKKILLEPRRIPP
jgi:hypothetical protein